jgi:capsular polysaccharide biosynthesis protein
LAEGISAAGDTVGTVLGTVGTVLFVYFADILNRRIKEQGEIHN